MYWIKGYSLIELLVVCCIIATIFSIMLPCIHHVQQYALIANCKSNLRQLHIGFMSYSQEHRGKLPHADRDSDTGPNNCWFDRIDHYLHIKNLYTIKQCPAWEGYNPLGETDDLHSIKMNGALCPKERLPETKEDRRFHKYYWPRVNYFRNKSQTVLLVDGRMDSPYDTHTDTCISQPFRDVANRHLGGCNLLFLDGSSLFENAKDGLAMGAIGWNSDGNYLWEPYQK